MPSIAHCRSRRSRCDLLVALLAVAASACGKLGYDPATLNDSAVDATPADVEVYDARADRDDAEASVDVGPGGEEPDVGLDDASLDAPADTGVDVTQEPDVGPPTNTDASVVDVAPPVDARADAACGRSLVIVLAQSTAQHGGNSSGTDYVDTCPSGEVIVGYNGSVDTNSNVPTVVQLQATCGKLLIDPISCQVHVGTGTTLQSRGGFGVTSFRQRCPVDQVMTRFRGRAGSYLDQFGIECAPVHIGINGSLQTGPITQVPPNGGTGGNPFEDGCPSDEVVMGDALRVVANASFLVWYGATCAGYRLMP